MSTPTLSATELAGIKARPQHFTNLWTLHFRHGMNPGLTKNFFHEGDLESAQLRARKHCEIMGYRYIFVRPMVIDIEAEEEYKKLGKEL